MSDWWCGSREDWFCSACKTTSLHRTVHRNIVHTDMIHNNKGDNVIVIYEGKRWQCLAARINYCRILAGDCNLHVVLRIL